MEKRFKVLDWYSNEIIKEFWTEDERDEWMDENCEYYSDGAYIEGIGKVYRQN